MKPGEAEFLYLTTTGRKTGQPREIEIWFTERAGHYYIVAEQLEDTQWVKNVRADPRVQVRVGDVRFDAHARVIERNGEPDLSQAVQDLSEQKYGWGDGLVVEIRPLPPPAR